MDNFNVYFAANFAKKSELQEIKKIWEEVPGLNVNSRWLIPGGHEGSNGDKALRCQFANEDLEDISNCFFFVFFADQFGPKPGKGKFLELGYAIAKKDLTIIDHIICIGDPTGSVFYDIDCLKWFPTWEEALAWVKNEISNENERRAELWGV